VEEGSPGLGSGSAAAADEGLDGRAGDLSLQGWEEGWLKTISALEGGETGGRAGQGVVGIPDP